MRRGSHRVTSSKAPSLCTVSSSYWVLAWLVHGYRFVATKGARTNKPAFALALTMNELYKDAPARSPRQAIVSHCLGARMRELDDVDGRRFFADVEHRQHGHVGFFFVCFFFEKKLFFFEAQTSRAAATALTAAAARRPPPRSVLQRAHEGLQRGRRPRWLPRACWPHSHFNTGVFKYLRNDGRVWIPQPRGPEVYWMTINADARHGRPCARTWSTQDASPARGPVAGCGGEIAVARGGTRRG